MSEVGGSSEVDRAIAAARSSWARISEDRSGEPLARPPRRRGAGSVGKRLARIAAADAAILVLFAIIGWIVPLGIGGALLLMAALLAATLALAVFPVERPPAPEALRTVDLRALPAQTERYLAAQRPALPAPARQIVDRIGTRLETLSPQLGRADADPEAAHEVRRLVGEQLPAFIADYARVPAPLRGVDRNGRSPDRELVDGLALIEREIGEMTARLAQGDLDSLQTRGRYLEMKYRDEGGAQ